jgi:hypothetical protein
VMIPSSITKLAISKPNCRSLLPAKKKFIPPSLASDSTHQTSSFGSYFSQQVADCATSYRSFAAGGLLSVSPQRTEHCPVHSRERPRQGIRQWTLTRQPKLGSEGWRPRELAYLRALIRAFYCFVVILRLFVT